jgi:hypothetical protein
VAEGAVCDWNAIRLPGREGDGRGEQPELQYRVESGKSAPKNAARKQIFMSEQLIPNIRIRLCVPLFKFPQPNRQVE